MVLAWPVGAGYSHPRIAMASWNIFKEVNTEMTYKLFVSKEEVGHYKGFRHSPPG
jgi:hypothetical protein